MYTILENARIVIALLKKHHIRHIVLSPGGSNIPIVQGVQQDPFFKCYSVVDERSAMYFAIGLHLQTGEPVATSCTSAQATRNYLPGLTEAYYKKIPILAITMSKHPKYLGQEYMQCPIQTSLPVDAVKKSYSLPRISNEHDRTLCIRMANEAMLELTHHGNGPVQLNLEELDSETWVFDENATLPEVRSIRRFHYWEDLSPQDLVGKRVMLLIGEHLPFTEEDTAAIEAFSSSHNTFIYCDHTSNYQGRYALNANPSSATITPALFQKEFMPDVVITIGGLTGDYFIYNQLSNAPVNSFEHWRVDIGGDVVDTYGKLSRIYELRPADFFKKMTSANQPVHSYFEQWKKKNDSITYDMEIPLSNLYAAIALSSRIPANSYVNFAILNSLRVWSFVQIPVPVKSFSNVAAFGIDGCMSTAIGESVTTDELCFHITGDLAFFYDMNALGIRHIKNNLRIMLCNNNGGMEFKFGDLVRKTDVGSYIAADNHFRDCEGWAKTNGFKYIAVHTKEEFLQVADEFVAPSDCPVIVEVFVTPENERNANTTFVQKNLMGTPNENLSIRAKECMKELIGPDGIEALKRIIKKC